MCNEQVSGVIDTFRKLPHFKKRLILALALSQPKSRQIINRANKKSSWENRK